MSGVEKVKANGSGGLDELESLAYTIFGGYDPAKHDAAWTRGLGDGRVDPGDHDSANLVLARRGTAYARLNTVEHREWLEQWLRDELSGYTGVFAHEAGWEHYGSVDIAVISAVAVYAAQRGHTELRRLCERWLLVVASWFSLAAFPGAAGEPARERATAALGIMPVGMRKQGHRGHVQACQLALQLGRPVDTKKITKPLGKQAYWVPCKIVHWAMSKGLALDEVAIDVLGAIIDGRQAPTLRPAGVAGFSDIRVQAAFVGERYELGGWIAMPREEGGLWCSYGSPGWQADWTGGRLRALEVDPIRKPVRRLCRVARSAGSVVVSLLGEDGSPAIEQVINTAQLGRRLWGFSVRPGQPINFEV